MIAAAFVCALIPAQAAAQAVPPAETPQHLVLIMPFENNGKTPGVDWISEAFPEAIGRRLAAEDALVISRADRQYAFERMGIPAGAHPSRATIYRIAQELDVDLAVLGSFTFDGRMLTARAQMLNVKSLRLTSEMVETGGLTQLKEVLNALAWDLLHSTAMHGPPPGDNFAAKRAFIDSFPGPRLDAFEKYIRGVTALGVKERIALLREAVKFDPEFAEARLALGRTLFESKDYEAAAEQLLAVSSTSPLAAEARFFAGLSLFYAAHFDRAEESFAQVVARLPLMEAVNNLGVTQARRGKRSAVEQFRKVAEADATDPDYHFNFAVALSRNGDLREAMAQLKESLSLNPNDGEAKALLDALTAGSPPQRAPLERIKRNYDETSYRQLQLVIERAREQKPPAP